MAQEILEFLRPQVAKWWLPDEVVFLEAIPKTGVGKFDKKILREQFMEGCHSSPKAIDTRACRAIILIAFRDPGRE